MILFSILFSFLIYTFSLALFLFLCNGLLMKFCHFPLFLSFCSPQVALVYLLFCLLDYCAFLFVCSSWLCECDVVTKSVEKISSTSVCCCCVRFVIFVILICSALCSFTCMLLLLLLSQLACSFLMMLFLHS